MEKKIKARKAKKEQSIKEIIRHISELIEHDENFILKIASEVGDIARMLIDLRQRVEALEKRKEKKT